MKNLTRKIMPWIAGGIIVFSGASAFGQGDTQIKEHKELIERVDKHQEEYKIQNLETDALLKYYKEDYKGAIRDYSEYLKQRPNDAGAYANLADCYDAIGQHETAIKYYLKSAKINQNDNTYLLVAEQYLEIDSIEKAHENVDKAISINPKEELYYQYKGSLYQKEGKIKQAQETLEKGLKNIPNSEDLKLLLEGNTYFLREEKVSLEFDAFKLSLKKKHKESIKCYDKLIKIFPDNQDYYIHRGIEKHKLATIFNPYKMFKYSFSALKDFEKVKNIAGVNTKFYEHAELFEKNTKNSLWFGGLFWGMAMTALGIGIFALRKKIKNRKNKKSNLNFKHKNQ